MTGVIRPDRTSSARWSRMCGSGVDRGCQDARRLPQAGLELGAHEETERTDDAPLARHATPGQDE